MGIEPKNNAASSAPAAAEPPAAAGAVNAMTDLTRRNAQRMLDAAQAAVRGCETASTGFAGFARDSSERTATAMRSMMTATTPRDLMEVQTDFARQQMAAVLAEMAKMAAVMVQTARDLMVDADDNAA